MSLILERSRAIRIARDYVRAARIDAEDGILRIDRVCDALLGLAARPELFPPEHFPVTAGTSGGYYRLSEEPDHRFAFYVSASGPRRTNLPHSHQSWTVVAGIRGEERNFIYDRVDERLTPGRGALRLRRQVTVGAGTAIALFPGEFHHLAVTGSEVSLQLHVYGVGFEGWSGELPIFPTPDSGVYDTVPAPLPGLRLGLPLVPAGDLVDTWCAAEPLAVVTLGGVPPNASPIPDPIPMTLEGWDPGRLPRDRDTALVLIGNDEEAHLAALKLLRSGYRTVLRSGGATAMRSRFGVRIFDPDTPKSRNRGRRRR